MNLPGTGTPLRITAQAVLVDIEGTTSTIAFVHQVLFPYADAHLDAYVAAHRSDPEVAAAMREAAKLAGEPADADDATVLAQLHGWIAEDRKATPLKTIQGLIWADGYARGELRAHVYPDAAAGLRRWHAAGVDLYVYSSGSIGAQKVLFANNSEGDLTALFSGHFDTTIGHKREMRSRARCVRRPRTSSFSATSTPSSTPQPRLACKRCGYCGRPTRRPAPRRSTRPPRRSTRSRSSGLSGAPREPCARIPGCR